MSLELKRKIKNSKLLHSFPIFFDSFFSRLLILRYLLPFCVSIYSITSGIHHCCVDFFLLVFSTTAKLPLPSSSSKFASRREIFHLELVVLAYTFFNGHFFRNCLYINQCRTVDSLDKEILSGEFGINIHISGIIYDYYFLPYLTLIHKKNKK